MPLPSPSDLPPPTVRADRPPDISVADAKQHSGLMEDIVRGTILRTTSHLTDDRSSADIKRVAFAPDVFFETTPLRRRSTCTPYYPPSTADPASAANAASREASSALSPSDTQSYNDQGQGQLENTGTSYQPPRMSPRTPFYSTSLAFEDQPASSLVTSDLPLPHQSSNHLPRASVTPKATPTSREPEVVTHFPHLQPLGPASTPAARPLLHRSLPPSLVGEGEEPWIPSAGRQSIPTDPRLGYGHPPFFPTPYIQYPTPSAPYYRMSSPNGQYPVGYTFNPRTVYLNHQRQNFRGPPESTAFGASTGPIEFTRPDATRGRLQGLPQWSHDQGKTFASEGGPGRTSTPYPVGGRFVPAGHAHAAHVRAQHPKNLEMEHLRIAHATHARIPNPDEAPAFYRGPSPSPPHPSARPNSNYHGHLPIAFLSGHTPEQIAQYRGISLSSKLTPDSTGQHQFQNASARTTDEAERTRRGR